VCQATLASRLGIIQPAVSRLERNLNRMMVATLRAVVQASNDRWQILSLSMVNPEVLDGTSAVAAEPRKNKQQAG
jgi:hypothetical protein